MALIGKPDLDRDLREWDVGGSQQMFGSVYAASQSP
jgi:hypothetical protein